MQTDFTPIVAFLCEHMTHEQIRQEAGLCSTGHVANIKAGRQHMVTYDVGVKLKQMHAVWRRKLARRAAQKA